MRKIILTAALALCCGVVEGQIARWDIPLAYGQMRIADGADKIITDSLQTICLWSFDGEKLFESDGLIGSFREGYAVLSKPGSDILRGFLSESGVFTPFEEDGYQIAKDYPLFSGGYLLIRDARSKQYYFVNLDNNLSQPSLVDAFPFFNGYASCQLFLSQEKQKDLRYALMDNEFQQVIFSYGGKIFSPSDVDFVSSVNDQNFGIVVVKKKVYLFSGVDQSLTPVCLEKNSRNLKLQGKIQGEPFEWFYVRDDEPILTARCGKTGNVTVSFDEYLRPVSIQYNDEEVRFSRREVESKQYHSQLRGFEENGFYGMLGPEKEILPAQFQSSPICFSDHAIVKLSGKYGMLKVLPEDAFRVTIYRGKDIPFKHQTFETSIRLDVPSYISAHHASLEIDPDSGCAIDKTSGEAKDTQWGNFIEYQCTLHMPKTLSDDEPEELVYPGYVIYNSLMSPEFLIKAKAWHYKYFVVDVIDSETVLNDGALSFTFNINASRDVGEDIYPMPVNVMSDSLVFTVEKLSEIRYKVRVDELKEGLNNIVIQVIEQGCPPVSFPFEIMYTKPVADAKGRKTGEEKVEIKKKPQKPKQELFLKM